MDRRVASMMQTARSLTWAVWRRVISLFYRQNVILQHDRQEIPSPPPLPSELIILIFTLAASNSRQSALSLCLVSSWARAIADPRLFSVVVLKRSDEALSVHFGLYPRGVIPGPGLGRAVDKGKNLVLSFGGPSKIRSIWIPHAYFDTVLAGSLPLLTNLHDVALGEEALTRFVNASADSVSQSPRDLHLTVLGPEHWPSIFQTYVPDVRMPYSPVYSQVTHLRFVERMHLLPGSTRQRMRLHACDLFPRLTHLATPFDYEGVPINLGPLQLFEQALTHQLRNLQLLVLLFYDEDFRTADLFVSWLQEIRKRDRRVCILTLSRENVQKEWKAEAEGGENLWERAMKQTRDWELSL